jgi:type I restriction enzyme S subunit
MTFALDLETPQWANKISSNVSLIPLGRLVRLRNEKNDPIQIEQILSLTADRGVILYEDKGAVGNQASEDISRYSIVRKGDIVVNSMNVIIGSVGLSKYDGVLSPVYYVLTPLDNGLIDMRYLAYHFKIESFQKSLIRIGYGILDHRMRIPWVNLKSELIAVPSLSVQKEIVEYLDNQISLINSLTQNFKKYLELAEEALALRISENLKPSDDESSWTPSKISWSFKTGSGTTPRSDSAEYYDGDVMWVNSGDLNNSYISTSKSKLSKLALEHFSTLRLYLSLKIC